MLDKLNQQESHDQQLRSLQNGPNAVNRTSLLPRTGHTPEPPTLLKNTLTLAEKKRLQWQQEKGISHSFELIITFLLFNFLQHSFLILHFFSFFSIPFSNFTQK
jgi:hypothetical protein